MKDVPTRLKARIGTSLRRILLAHKAPMALIVTDERLTYLGLHKLSRIVDALALARTIDGDICEFGLALGGSGIVLANGMAPDQRFFGFDVFGMIPPPTSDKDDVASKQRYQAIVSGQSEGLGGDTYYGYRDNLYEDVVKSFNRHGLDVDGRRVSLIKGLFEETLPSVEIDRIALAHIDCDWYDPVRLCLAFCAPRMASGGAIIIDDYNDYGGCRFAVDEFLADNRAFRIEQGANPVLRLG